MNTYDRDGVYLRTWTSRTGEKRRYINNWWRLVGLEVGRYNSGNIRWADLNGESLSNSAARRFMAGNAWIDEDGVLHLRDHAELDRMSLPERRERILAGLAEMGITVQPD